MKTINIPEKLSNAYHGCGYAAGIIVNDELISFRYLEDNNIVYQNEILGMLSCYQFCYDDERIIKEYENV